jgi:hypothetical protein
MANTKISALTSATTPLAGTEVLPIVQSSVTVKVAVSNLTAGRSVSATNFIPSGSSAPTNGLYLPAANSVGIATNSTNAVTIDSAQNVGIGTSSPVTYGQLAVVSASTNSTSINSINTSTSGGSIFVLSSGNGTTSSQYNYMSFVNSQTVSQTWRFGNYGGDNLTWQNVTAGTASMTLDTSGNLLTGTTNSSSTAGIGIKALANATGPAVAVVGSASTGATSAYRLYSTGAGAYRFYVDYGGTISATATSITGISDQRLKENIRDLDDGLNAVLALKPRKFDWKEGKGSNTKDARGFIAQEFETVFPDMIQEWLDPAPEGEEPYKAINANLFPTLVKAIQELNTIMQTQAETINSLTARVVALESK